MDKGFDIKYDFENMGFVYGENVYGPKPERRRLDEIRRSLKDPQAAGPEVVYAIAMDVGEERDREDLISRNLLYGAVIYSKGRLGEEPIRSQGHVHAVSPSCGMSTPEMYEIHAGKAFIYMQESTADDPLRCFAVYAGAGDTVIVPPGWGHATISADPDQPLAFGAWCVRDFGFDYDDVRAHGGLAYFPLFDETGTIKWEANGAYRLRELVIKPPRSCTDFGVEKGKSIYRQYREERERFDFVANPRLKSWDNFVP